MLTDKEKQEMLVDSRSKGRRDQFRRLKELEGADPMAPAEYLAFLSKVQKFFSSIRPALKK